MKRLVQILVLLLLFNHAQGQLYFVNMDASSKWTQDSDGITRIKVY